MAAYSIHPESVLARFWRDEGHAPFTVKLGLALLILNEIRGASVVASLVWVYFERG
jgi:hypothetical protein